MENINTISVTDVVNLIIDKNVKKIDDIIAEKRNMIDELEKKYRISVDENVKKLKIFFTENFEESGLNHFMSIMYMMFGRMGGFGMRGMDMDRRGMDMDRRGMGRMNFGGDNDKYSWIYKEMYLCGLVLKGDEKDVDTIKNIEQEIRDLNNKKYDIRNSKDKLITEVTLQRLTSIDVDFSNKLDLLAERVFGNKQETKSID